MRLEKIITKQENDSYEIAKFIYHAIEEQSFERAYDGNINIEIKRGEEQSLAILELYAYKDGTDVYSSFYDWIESEMSFNDFEEKTDDEIIEKIKEWIDEHREVEG